MVEIIKVATKKEQKEFIEFPLRMYRDCPYFVPPLYSSEKDIFKKNYVYRDTCEDVFFLARKDGKTVGRISAILQKASNEKTGEKRVRFTRFDSVNDIEVAKALFDAAEGWALEKGMDTVCGPLGYSDLEREGLLIEGFDQLSTFEEQYNYDYYQTLIEACGYEKEVDWVESKLMKPKEDDAKLKSLTEFVLKRYDLHIGKAKNINDFIKKYADEMFDVLDESYKDIYGTVPFTDATRKMMIDNFKLIVDVKHVAVILDKNDRVVCFGICFPSLAKAVQKSGGRLTIPTLLRILKVLKKPEIIDLALIGVTPEYMNKGVATVFMAKILEMLDEPSVKYIETNLNLEENYSIRNHWKRFDSVEHKRRRAYVKKIAR